MRTEEVFNSLTEAAQRRGIKYRGGLPQLGKELKQLVPKFRKVRGSLLPVEAATPGYRERQYKYEFPPLQDCREHFDQLMGIQTDWPKE